MGTAEWNKKDNAFLNSMNSTIFSRNFHSRLQHNNKSLNNRHI